MNDRPPSTLQPAIQHVRIARPTDRLAELTAFYRDVLDLEILTSFDHDGFAGVMLGRNQIRICDDQATSVIPKFESTGNAQFGK